MSQVSEDISPKAERSRALILSAAKKLICENGFNGVTLQDILETAKVTKGRFFHYFRSKEDLFEQLLKETFSNRERLFFEKIAEETKSNRAIDKLFAVLDGVIAWHKKGLPEMMRLCAFATFFFSPQSAELQEAKSAIQKNARVVENLISQSQKQRDLPSDISPRVFSLLLPSASIGGNTIGFITGEDNLTSRNLTELKILLTELHQSTKRGGTHAK